MLCIFKNSEPMKLKLLKDYLYEAIFIRNAVLYAERRRMAWDTVHGPE